jgi:Xaa-Pro aminopeptidase
MSMAAYSNRLKDLRTLLTELGADGFIVPRTDAHQGEYVAPCDERLAWLTGFTGSAGMAIVLKEKAALFVDGRYTLQAQNQVDLSSYEICSLTDNPPCTWARKKLKHGQKILYDPWLHTSNDKSRAKKVCDEVGATFTPVTQNLIDKLWTDRPTAPANAVIKHDVAYAGVTSEEKRKQVSNILQEKKVDAALLSSLESVAWLLNIRGNDIPHTPVVQCFAILWADATVDLFINFKKVNPEMKDFLGSDIRIIDITSMEGWLGNLEEKTIIIDPALTPLSLIQQLDKCHLIHSQDPCALPKALKNPIEIKGAREAHIQDGVAVTRFLAWFSNAALSGNLTEMDAADKILSFRKQNPLLTDLSFNTISASGPNGAIVHYRVTPETNRKIDLNSLYLIDSGGQYLNGTTDITRTIAVGIPTPEQKDRFTRVLKGHIAIATALFPNGTTGSQLDALARLPLWQVGLDYEHGTGHGVGSYLNVHEGPQRISKVPSTVALQPGMIISNEPGYYKTNEYGIRIESLVLVMDMGTSIGGDRSQLGFETLTQVPIDRSLIDVSLLNEQERLWINTYHQKVLKTLLPHLDDNEAAWLKEATKEV